MATPILFVRTRPTLFLASRPTSDRQPPPSTAPPRTRAQCAAMLIGASATRGSDQLREWPGGRPTLENAKCYC